MRRYPFLRLLLPLVAGIVCGELFPAKIPGAMEVAGVSLAAGAFFAGWLCRRHLLCGGSLFLILFITGNGLINRWMERSAYPFPPDNAAAVYRVVLTDRAEEKQRSLLYRAELRGEIRDDADTLPGSRRSYRFLFYFPKDSASALLRRGDELLVHARLSPPVNRGNPNEFDYARYLARKGISGSAYVPAGHWQVTGHRAERTFRQVAADCRERMVGLYRSCGFRGDELAVLSALTVGDKEGLDEEIRETYAVTGASHVLALSGLHIGFLYLLCWLLLTPLWRRWRWTKPFLLLLIILLLWGFAFLTGLSTSVVRAVVMGTLLLLSQLQPHRPLTLNTLAAAAFLMLLCRPAWLFDVGFQLSFAAVAAILLFQPGLYALMPVRNPLLRKAWGLVTVSLAAQLGVAPLLVFYFYRFSTHFLLTNLWVVPCVSLVMYAAVLLLVLTPFPLLQQGWAVVPEWLIRLQNGGLRRMEQLPGAVVDHLWVDAWEVGVYYLCLLLAYRVLVKRTAASLRLALFAVVIGVSCHLLALCLRAPCHGIAFYNVQGCPAVHCLTDRATSWLVCADTLSDPSALGRSLAPYWNRLRLQPPVLLQGDCRLPELTVSGDMLLYGGKRICLLTDDRWHSRVADVPFRVDYLYITRSYRGSVRSLLPLFRIGTVVLDASVPVRRQERIIQECLRLEIPYLSLSEQGSVQVWL